MAHPVPRPSRPAPVIDPERRAPRPDTEPAVALALEAQRRAVLSRLAAEVLRSEAARLREQHRALRRPGRS